MNSANKRNTRQRDPSHYTRPTGSEYSDKIIKINRKADILLDMTLQILNRQERVAQHALNRQEHEMQKLLTRIKHIRPDSTLTRSPTKVTVLMCKRYRPLSLVRRTPRDRSVYTSAVPRTSGLAEPERKRVNLRDAVHCSSTLRL